MATSPNPFYGTQTDLVTPTSNLARAIVGNASDDAAIARAQAGRALAEKYLVERDLLTDRRDTGRRLSADPAYQRSIAQAFGFTPGEDGSLPPVLQDLALQYLSRGGNIDEFARGNRTVQGTGMMLSPNPTEDRLRIGGALLGLEPDKNTAYTAGRADTILEGDYAVRRRGQDITAETTRRGQDISDATNRRGQDMRSEDTRRGQDIRSSDTRRGQDMRPTKGATEMKMTGKDYELVQNELTRLAKNANLSVNQELFDEIFSNASKLAQQSKDPKGAAMEAWRNALQDPDIVNERSTFLGMTYGKGELKRKPGQAAPAANSQAAGKSKTVDKLPTGAKKIGTSGGKDVYEDANGNRWIQE